MNSKLQIDLWFLVPVAILVIISLITLYSIDILYFKSQLTSLFVGVLGFLIFSKINIDFLRQLKTPIYAISIILLLMVVLIGVEARGASRWLELFGIRLQFSEILKPFLAISFAAALADGVNHKLKTFVQVILLTAPIIFLISIQPDLGSGLLYAGSVLFALFAMGFSLTWFLLLGIPFIVTSPIIWNILHNYQKQRILTFLDKGADPLGTSYNGIQAIIAVGSGSFFGKGISEGTQSLLMFLPERQTDFIFATIAEGLGFFGASIVVIAFFFILYRIYILFRERNDFFGRSFLAVCFGLFFIQGFVNIAMNMGLLPIVGITFPFVSFGGSSLLSNFIFLGLMSSFHSSKKTSEVLEIR